MSELSKEERIQRGDEAKRVLESPAFIQATEAVKQNMHDDFLNRPFSLESAQAFFAFNSTVEAIQTKLRSYSDDGRAAAR